MFRYCFFFVMYYTIKSVCAIAVTLPENQKTRSNMSEKSITPVFVTFFE